MTSNRLTKRTLRTVRALPGAVIITMVGALQPHAAMAAEPMKDKSGYHLFNPVPRELMRDLATDRPDGTESPYTVDAGHVQIEASLIDFTRDKGSGGRVETLTLMDTNLKFGLLNNMDLQIILPLWAEEQSLSEGAQEIINGTGDVTLRLKMNLWGNDQGSTAFGIMPFIKLPTGTDLSNGKTEGGLISMFSWQAGEKWGLGLMAEIDAVYDEAEGDHDMQFVHTAVIGFDLMEPLGAYVEYIGIAADEGDFDYQAQLSTGLTWGLSEDVQLDTGVRIGLNEAAEDLTIFAGFSIRF